MGLDLKGVKSEIKGQFTLERINKKNEILTHRLNYLLKLVFTITKIYFDHKNVVG